MPASWIDITVNESAMEGYLTQPEDPGRHPAVVVIQEIWGVNSHIQAVVDRLRQLQEELTLDEIIYEVNYGSLIPEELQLKCLRLLNEKVIPKLK